MLSRTMRTIACSAALLTTISFHCVAADAEPAAGTTASSQVNSDHPVLINQASAEEIADALDGIGLAKAQAIVDYRKMNGPFTSLAMLEAVKGIGAKTIAANSAKIAFDIPLQQ